MRGVEFIYARTPTTWLSSKQLPKNSWGFGRHGPVNGLEWWDFRPQLTPKLGHLWRSQRDVEGMPVYGTAIPGSWSTPQLVGRHEGAT